MPGLPASDRGNEAFSSIVRKKFEIRMASEAVTTDSVVAWPDADRAVARVQPLVATHENDDDPENRRFDQRHEMSRGSMYLVMFSR